MIFLIGKMFVYLLVAMGLGAAAGWLWRHQQAAAREAEMERQLMDTRSRFPQVETALRTREQQIEGLLAEVHARDEALAEQTALVAERDRSLVELERSCAGLRQRLESLQSAAPVAATSSGDELELHPGEPESAAAATPAADAPAAPVGAAAQEPAAESGDDPGETVRANAEAREETAAAAPASDDDGERQRLDGERQRLDGERQWLDGERQRLAEELEAAQRELDRARSALVAEQRRVAELTQERALQHRALAALEQQLEIVRDEGRAASG